MICWASFSPSPYSSLSLLHNTEQNVPWAWNDLGLPLYAVNSSSSSKVHGLPPLLWRLQTQMYPLLNFWIRVLLAFWNLMLIPWWYNCSLFYSNYKNESSKTAEILSVLFIAISPGPRKMPRTKELDKYFLNDSFLSVWACLGGKETQWTK